MIKWWREYEDHKLLPFPGGVDDQPIYVWELFKACSIAQSEAELRRLEGAHG